jgi:hypothetical protein
MGATSPMLARLTFAYLRRSLSREHRPLPGGLFLGSFSPFLHVAGSEKRATGTANVVPALLHPADFGNDVWMIALFWFGHIPISAELRPDM